MTRLLTDRLLTIPAPSFAFVRHWLRIVAPVAVILCGAAAVAWAGVLCLVVGGWW